MIKQVIKLNKDEYLFKSGDSADAMYIIERGIISITKSQNDSEVVLAELTADDLIGEMGFFNHSKRSANARVLSTVAHLAVLPYAALRSEYDGMPKWIKAVIKSINTNLILSNARVQELEQRLNQLKKQS